MVEGNRQALTRAENEYDENKRQLNQTLSQIGDSKYGFNQYLESLSDNLRQVKGDDLTMPVAVLEEMRTEAHLLFDRAEDEIENKLTKNQHEFNAKQELYETAIRDELMKEIDHESRNNFR